MILNQLRKINAKKNLWIKRQRDNEAAAFYKHMANSEPIVILGNQKTGSTAIAALLAKATRSSVTLDLQKAIHDVGWQLCVKYGVTKFDEIAYRYKEDFLNTIIKEPSLTYFYDELKSLIPNAKFVFIQRDPYQNIRSILNRLKIPGDLKDIEYDDWDELRKTPVWRLALDSTWLGCSQGGYIEGMAQRWNLAANTYFGSQDDFILIRYENFIKNKKLAVESLASQLGLEIQEDISAFVDVQHQPKGNSNLPICEFFGEANQKIIKDICAENARKLGYEL